MATDSLFNLSGPGKPLKAEPPDAAETAGLLRTGRARLHDAANLALSLDQAAGKTVMSFDSIPVRRCDKLVNTEATVA